MTLPLSTFVFCSHSLHIQSRPTLQGNDLTFASVGASGQLLQIGKDKDRSLKVHGHTPTRSAVWKLSGNSLVNVATDTELGMMPKLIHAFCMDEIKDMEKFFARSERQHSAQVLHFLYST